MGENSVVGVESSEFWGLDAGSTEVCRSPVVVNSMTMAEMKPPIGGSRRKGSGRRVSMEEEDFLSLLHGSDPVKIELNRLENEVRDKDRELAEAQSEIKALKLTERAKEKALSEVTEDLHKILEKFQASEIALENKNLEVKRINEEKKEAIAAQFAAEATLRRVHAAQKDDDIPPLEAILAPLEAEMKILRQEVIKLQDDNKALERLTKTKEAALLEAEKEVHLAKVKAALVDDLLNRNQELVKQNDICQEEYKILDRMHRQKVADVEKLGQTVQELEEALLSGAAAANAVRDYQRQVNELKGEKKTLERTLSRAKVTENRVAVVVANEWKDANDKVMPVKQWLEERRFLMGEMQQLRDKLVIVERAARTEAQLKEKFQLRLKVIDDTLKSSVSRCNGSPRFTPMSSGGISSNMNYLKKSHPPYLKSSSFSRNSTSTLKNAKGVSKSFDGGNSLEGSVCRSESFQDMRNNEADELQIKNLRVKTENEANTVKPPSVEDVGDDIVSGVLHDLLQKEVITLRKSCIEKDQGLKDRDSSIEMLTRKVDTLNKAMEVESKKSQREKAALVKEIDAIRSEKEQEQKTRRLKATISNLRN